MKKSTRFAHRGTVGGEKIRAHVVKIRRGGEVIAVQMRIGQGAGESAYFSASKHGGEEGAMAAALKKCDELGAVVKTGRGGGMIGRRVTGTNVEPGITLKWREYGGSPKLTVEATWAEAGRRRKTCYSVDKNGLEGALDKAIQKRMNAGAPKLNREALLAELRSEYMTRLFTLR
jgi:hypothetical protein